jgi:PAS domain S-box-containing protein
LKTWRRDRLRTHVAEGSARVVSVDTDASPGPAGSDVEDLLRTIVDASTVYSIVALDRDGQILLWNEGARRLYGYAAEEVVGRPASALHTPEDVADGLPGAMLDVAGRDGTWEGTVTRVRKDGSRFAARVVLTPRRGPCADVVGYLLISKDVSDCVRLTEQFEATQFYTRSLIESNIDALMTTDPLGVVTDANEQMEALTGRSRDELIGTRFKQYFTDPARAEDGIRVVLHQGRVTNYELTVRHRDGRETVVSCNAATFQDRDGRLWGVVASARDVTENKALEVRLRESESYHRGLIEASADGLITVRPDGVISDVNEQMCRVSGYPREELIGSAFTDYFVDPDRAAEGVAETLGKGVVTDYVLDLARPSGETTKVSFNASVFRDGDGRLQGIFASARDITEQDRLQAQLAAEREYNRGLIEASLDALVTVDPALTISDVNEAMCRMTGYRREELIGSAFQDYFTDPSRAAAGVRLTLAQGGVTNYELALRTKDGGGTLVSFNASVFRSHDGEVQGIFASARDITAQAGLQAELAEEQAYNRGLIEASVDALLTVDETMTINDVNETVCRLVGRPRSQLIGSSFPTYFKERDLAAEGVRLTFAEGQVTNYVLTLLAADGRALPVSFNAAVFKDTAGEVKGILASARDITDQQRLEHQLRDAQSYTRSLIESNIDALITTDPVGVITDVNEQMELLTGCSREELVGTRFKGYFTDPDRAEDGIRLVLQDGKVTNYELTARHRDGREIVVSYNAATFYHRDGRLRGVFAAARGVADQKALELRLREQQTYLRGLIESSVDGLVTVDPDGFITDVNEQMCRMTGYDRAELVGTRFADYFTDPERARDGVKQTFGSGVVTEYALTIVSRTRRQLHVSFNASVFTDPDGQVRGIFASARDITDRVRLEEQLREQQTHLRGLIESSVDGLVTVDPDGFITDVNEQMCRMSGYAREELIGSQFRRYFTDPERADAGVNQTLTRNVVTNYQLVLKNRNGRQSTVSVNASVFRTDGLVQGIFASARDISEQARLQQQLAEQQAYTRSLIEASADALFAIAPDGVITDVNEEATRLTGFSRKHLVNSQFSDYFTDPRSASAGVAETFDQGRVLGYELNLMTRHGRRITVSFNAGVFTDASGTPLGILASARDITAQKQLEQQLRDSQLYTRSLIESNIDALMTTDPLGVITDVNEQMEWLTGHSREELVGTPFKNFFTEPGRAEEGIRLALREGKVENYELTARSKDGRQTVVSYNGTTFCDRDGRLQGVLAAARDVTDRKRFEQALQETNNELEAASLSKDRFLASMSHELRTPLNAILGFTGTLLMQLPGPLNDEQRRQLTTVRSSGHHLLSIINDLLDVAKIDSGKVVLSREAVDCAALVTEVADGLRTLADAKNLALDIVPPADTLIIETDRRALSQILINLANNAIKFTDRGSVVLHLDRQVRDGVTTAVFSVVDTGIGVPPEEQDRLFRAFEQVGDRAGHTEGTGLGLYISRRLATLLGAHIEFTSEHGKGSAFRVVVPAVTR